VTRVSELVSRAVEQGPLAALAALRNVPPRSHTSGPAVRPVRSAEDALDALQRWLAARAEREPQVAAYVLGGLYGAPLDELRKQLAERVPTVVLSGLDGLTDDVSWELRDKLCHEQPIAVARSLNSVAQQDPRAASLRQRLELLAPAELLRSLARCDDDESWALRDRLYDVYAEAAVASLAGLVGERAGALRERWFVGKRARLADSYELSRVAARSVHAVGDDLAWEIRDAARQAAPIASLSSLGELRCERSWALRERSLRRATKVVMETLRRLCEPQAWEMRWQVASETKEAIDSIADLDVEEAWSMREAFADVWTSTVVKTLGLLAETDRGRTLVERQLLAHPNNVSLLKHAAAIAILRSRTGEPRASAAVRGSGAVDVDEPSLTLPPRGVKSA
jgi:dTMP kinase